MQMMSAQVETSRQLVIDGDGKFIYDGTMAQILLVSYKPKAIIISGEDNPEVLEKLGGGVLGHKWLPTEDELEFCSTINISPRTSSGKTGPNLTLDDLPKTKDDDLHLHKETLPCHPCQFLLPFRFTLMPSHQVLSRT